MQEEYEAAANAILAAGMASDSAKNSPGCCFTAEFLEFDGAPGGNQLIVNADSFAVNDIDRVQDRLCELAEAIATAFNAIDGITEDAAAAWYVHSECNWWDENGNKVDESEPSKISTIQWCIFNG